MDLAVQQGVLPRRLFTADLKIGVPGSYDFGFIDECKYTGLIYYAE